MNYFPLLSFHSINPEFLWKWTPGHVVTLSSLTRVFITVPRLTFLHTKVVSMPTCGDLHPSVCRVHMTDWRLPDTQEPCQVWASSWMSSSEQQVLCNADDVILAADERSTIASCLCHYSEWRLSASFSSSILILMVKKMILNQIVSRS